MASSGSVSMKRARRGTTARGLGINRRNKLCGSVEVAGKIEFADSAALVAGKDRLDEKRNGENRRANLGRITESTASRRWFLASNPCFPLFHPATRSFFSSRDVFALPIKTAFI